ncbi:ABC-2 type transport system permease protein [Tistlia consotensis]|uniref:Transport permease protein n=1 Tax=Tistlia consotensis USBA 355 TaxID=560819 RepID=A0A1Y6B4Y3_9PROT|nr:ABC transporter permease [Tistlia consotensis]SME92368.1 ABC-2 type transport system permease protein [Tistlia consotensis USBA 355]SNR28003.1 ABC-2 type transport system permease protein [Tistlia consotensis]
MSRREPLRGEMPHGSMWGRVGAMVLRHLYLMRSSWPRVVELAYWPTIQMVIWGFVTLYLLQSSSVIANAAGVLVTAVILWDVLFRGQLGFTLSFIEEIWSRNLGNLAVSPLRPHELLVALTVMSFLRTLIGVLPATGLAILFYGISIYDLGLPLVAFVACLLVMSWALGMLVSSLILRVGQGAENVAWLAIFLLAPISSVYYPVSVLPPWLQAIAWCFPMTPTFEGMRAILIHGTFRPDLLVQALALDGVYLAIGAAVFLYTFRVARRHGLLLQQGE